MARELIMKMTDDIDRSPATTTRVIGWEGFDYILDLSDKNDEALVAALQPYLDAAHEKVKQPKSKKSQAAAATKPYVPVSAGKAERRAIREWAAEHGYQLSMRGTIPGALLRRTRRPTVASEEVDRTVHAEHRMCRVFMHAWDYTTVKRVGGDYLQGLICMRCGTERFMKIDARTGLPGGSTYKYAEGYLFHGGGALTAEERAELRLLEVAGHLPRRRRKR